MLGLVDGFGPSGQVPGLGKEKIARKPDLPQMVASPADVPFGEGWIQNVRFTAIKASMELHGCDQSLQIAYGGLRTGHVDACDYCEESAFAVLGVKMQAGPQELRSALEGLDEGPCLNGDLVCSELEREIASFGRKFFLPVEVVAFHAVGGRGGAR